MSKFLHIDPDSFLISCLVDGDLNKALGLANAGPMYTYILYIQTKMEWRVDAVWMFKACLLRVLVY
jgi:hypothetical protein